MGSQYRFGREPAVRAGYAATTGARRLHLSTGRSRSTQLLAQNYHLNPVGRFVEINTLTSGPAPSAAVVSLDADPATSAIETYANGGAGVFNVGVVVSGMADIGFNVDVRYDPRVLSAPTVSSGDTRDRNPDANQSFLESTGRPSTCTPPDPATAIAAGSLAAARIVCTSSGPLDGPAATSAQTIATVSFRVLAGSSGSALSLANVNVFNHGGDKELASCNPTVSVITTCVGASVATQPPTDTDGDGYGDEAEVALGKNPMVFCAIMRADIDNSGKVGFTDLLRLASSYSASVGAATYDARADFDASGRVNFTDLLGFAQQYNKVVADCP